MRVPAGGIHGLLWTGLLAGAVALATLIATPPVTAAEKPRLLSAVEGKAWRGVGRVNIAGARRRGMCTGTLIAPDIVLTAAHCLVNSRSGAVYAAGNIHFVTGWYQGKGTGHSKASAVVLHPDYRPAAAPSRRTLGNDIALVRLRKAIPAGSARPFAVGTPPLPGARLTLVSYRRDRPHALSYQDGCPYRSVADQVLTLDCPVIQGASGSPLFAATADGPRVVGVLSAMGRDTSLPKAFAVRADLAVAELLKALP